VLIHLTNPNNAVASMFSGGIVESGPLAMNFKGVDEATTLGRTFSINLGCAYTDMQCHQSKNTTQVLNAMKKTLNVPLR
jgi:hypothetical protein